MSLTRHLPWRTPVSTTLARLVCLLATIATTTATTTAMAQGKAPEKEKQQQQQQQQQQQEQEQRQERAQPQPQPQQQLLPDAATDTTATDAFALAQARAAYEKALLALQQQRWGQAELLLERTLMFHPEHAEALLQLAALLAQRDRLESAQALIAMLLQDPRTPPLHRLQLQALLDSTGQQHASSATAPGQTVPLTPPLPVARTQVLWSAGYTRNPLGITDAAQLTLTLPGGPVVLPLAVQAQATLVGTAALHHQTAGGLELYAQTQHTTLTQARHAGRLALAGPLGLKGYLWSINTQRALDGSTRHSAALVKTLQGSNTQLSASLFYESSLRRTGWQARAQHTFELPARSAITAWAEYEQGGKGAPGALRSGLQALAPLAPQWQLQGLLYGHADTSGYSPLLQDNAPRRLLTLHAELEYRWPGKVLGGQAALSAYAARRWSNLPLFGWSDHGARLSWLRQW